MKKKYIINAASSFMGFNFIQAIAKLPDIEVVCLFKGSNEQDYTGRYLERLVELKKLDVEFIFGINSNEKLLKFLEVSDFDFFHFHDSYTLDYRSDQFDLAAACNKNFNVLRELYELFSERKKLECVIISESYFQHPKNGKQKTLYSLSKSINSQAHRFFCDKHSLNGKFFVIPNPVGPFENNKLNHKIFTSILSGDKFESTSPLEKSINIFGVECAGILIDNIFYRNDEKIYSMYPEVKNETFIKDMDFIFRLLKKNVSPTAILEELKHPKKSPNSLLSLERDLKQLRLSCLLDYLHWLNREYLR
jgi:nucleoside-diphosphate-sugar epimerase